MTGVNRQEIDRRILTIRGQSALFDLIITELYGVTTKVVKTSDHITGLKFATHLCEAFTEKGRDRLDTTLKRGSTFVFASPELPIS